MPSELLKPVSWTSTWRYGLVSNIDEPFATPDGSAIGEDGSGGVLARIQMSDIQNIRDIDLLDGIIIKLRSRRETDPFDELPEVRLYIFWLIDGSVRGSFNFVEPDTFNLWTNRELSFPVWDSHIQVLTPQQLNSLEIIIQVASRAPDVTPVLVEVDTLEVEIVYSLPPPILKDPDEVQLTLTPKSLVYPLVNYYRRPADGELLLPDDKISTVFREDTIRLIPSLLLLNEQNWTQNFTFYPGKKSLSLAGKVPVLDFSSPTAKGSVTLAGKVPDDIDQTENQLITVPDGYTSHLLLSGQNVGDEDTRMPDRLRTYLSGDAPTAELSYTVSPDAVSMQVGQPPGSERLWPESWVPVWFEPGWSGNITDIDEPPDEPDGAVISVNQPSALCSIYFSDVKLIRDGIDTITGVKPTFRVRAAAGVVGDEVPSIKLWSYVYINDNFVSTHTMSINPFFVTYELPVFTYPGVQGTDTGPINSMYMNWAIYDAGVTAEIDLISYEVFYDYDAPSKVPLLGRGERPAKGTLSLQGKKVTALNSTDAVSSGSVSLAGEQPLLFRSLILELIGKGIALDAALPVPGTALAFTGKAPVIAPSPDEAVLSLTGIRPVFVFGSVIPPGDHGIMSLSTRYDIEHIATPKDELEF
jgi:hypothetical protein